MRARRGLAPALLALAACASGVSDVSRDPAFRPSPSAPVRIAVLPFEDRTGGVSPLLYPFLPIIWLVDLVTLQLPDKPLDTGKGAETLRAMLIARLRLTSVDVVDAPTVDAALAARGWLGHAAAVPPVEMARALGVDAVLTGRLLRWSTRWFVLQSESAVTAEVRIRSGRDGEILFAATVKENDETGLTGGPSGFTSLASEPLAELGSATPFPKLAFLWAFQVGELIAAEPESQILEMNVPGRPPEIHAIAVSAPRDGRAFAPGETMEVFAVGSPGCRAWFEIGYLRSFVPMSEFLRPRRTGNPRSREVAGLYRGSFVVGANDRVDGAPVAVRLESPKGRSAARIAPGVAVRVEAAAKP